jgi:hypothetical protein
MNAAEQCRRQKIRLLQIEALQTYYRLPATPKTKGASGGCIDHGMGNR